MDMQNKVNSRGIKDYARKLKFIFSTIFVAFHLYTAFMGNLYGFAQSAIHLGLLIVIAYLDLIIKNESSQNQGKGLRKIVYSTIIVFSFIYSAYMWYNSPQLMRDATTFLPSMGPIGIFLILVLLISCWKFVGSAMAVLAVFFIIYALFGRYFPFIMRHAGMLPKRFLHLICFTSEGIYGSPLSASASYIVVFIALGSMFNVTGVGDYLCDFANVLMGKYRGGPAKVAVVSSALFGSISGSTVANVVSTGSFTIPLMKKTGCDSEFAGAVEAAASTGGALMPPVMGAAAFLLAEVVGVKYWAVVTAAIIPAVLYYLAILFQVDLYALKYGLSGVQKQDMPPINIVVKGIWKLSPLVLLVLLIGVYSVTIQRAGIYTFLYMFLISFATKETRLNKEKLKVFIEGTAMGCVTVAIATATAGIIIGSITGSGLSIRLSAILVKISGGHLSILLILVMLTSIILGMGLPVTACYLMLAALVAPAIIKMGVIPMAAHLFILYFGIISNVTPPVAMAAFAGAGIAECNPTRCGYKAFKLAAAGFILPFFFVYNNALLLEGPLGTVLRCCVTATIGIYSLACALEGAVWNAPIQWPVRAVLMIASVSLIQSGTMTDLLGCVLIISVHLYYNIIQKRKTVRF
jgi:TRAP transporter 4TM/12TM fusion protein